MSEKITQLLARASAGFNDVGAWLTPNGEVVISLSHRNTNDYDVLIRVRGEDDVILAGMLDLHTDSDPWEDETTQVGRLNKGGNWDA